MDQLKTGIRRVARHLRHTPDRLLHPLRRRSAGRSDYGSAASVLFVCYGNICRSPYAEVAYRQMCRPDGRIASAGFVGPDRPSPPEARSVAARRGVDLGDHRSQLLSRELLAGFELVVVMEPSQARALRMEFGRADHVLVLGDLDPARIDTRMILDPYGRAESYFEEVYERIDRCLRRLCGL